jgi:hypothetical protein
MRKIKIMMMMPLFLAVSLFFAGCNQSADNDDDTPTGGVPVADAYLSGGDAIRGVDNGIANRHISGEDPTTVLWTAAINTIRYSVSNGSGIALETVDIPDATDGSVYPLVPAGKTLILDGVAQNAGISPSAGGTQVVVDGSLYLVGYSTLTLGPDPAETNPGTILLRNGRLVVTHGTTLRYGSQATVNSVTSSSGSALRVGGIDFLDDSQLDFQNIQSNFIVETESLNSSYITLSDIWNNSGRADVNIRQGSIKSTYLFDFPVTPNRQLLVFGNGDQPEIPAGVSGGPYPDVTIKEGLAYVGIGNLLEHVNLVVNGTLAANYHISPYAITVGPNGWLYNYPSTDGSVAFYDTKLDKSLSIASGGRADLYNLKTTRGAVITEVSVADNAVLAINEGNTINFDGPIDGTLILTGNNYDVTTNVGGQLEYRAPGGTVTLNNADLKGVKLSGGSASIKGGASLAVTGNLQLSGNNGKVLVGGSLAADYAALELNNSIRLDGGFTLSPVGGTAAEIGLTSEKVIINDQKTLATDKGALSGIGGKILFTNGANEDDIVGADGAEDEGVVYSLQGNKFLLGSASLDVTNSLGYAALDLTGGASIVFGATDVGGGVSLLNGQYIISSREEDADEGPTTQFVLGEVYNDYISTTPVKHIGIGIGPETNPNNANHILTLGPDSKIIFGGPGGTPKYLLVGHPGASVRNNDVNAYSRSQFAIRGTGTSPATIETPNFLVVGSLGVFNEWVNAVNYEPLFANDSDLKDSTDPEDTNVPYASGDITVKVSGASLSIQHNNIWTWGSHTNGDGDTVGKWTTN